MKFVKVWGGIGNQLFQYYFGKYLQHKTKDIVVYINQSGYVQVPNMLDSFLNLDFDNTRRKENLKYNHFYFNQLYRINRKIVQIIPNISKMILVEDLEDNLSIDMIEYELFDGYWQDLHFVETLKNDGHFQFSFSNLNGYQNNIFYPLIYNTTNSVSVHIRRGDYLQSDYHKTLDLDYYNKSFEIISQRVTNPVFFIFSDDLTWAKENFLRSYNIVFVDNKLLIQDDTLDFYLMSLCKHHIIANSTFSWWPAYLKNQTNSLTIAPQYWFNKNNKRSEKILKKEWIIQ